MASSYSTNLAIELIGTGDQAGTWGTTTNTNLGTLIEQAISGYVTQAVSTGTDTTITIPNGATGVARNMYIELTGTGGASTNLIVPSNKKLYFVFNNTASGQVTVKVSGQTGVSVPNGAKMILVSDGTDIVDATNYVGNISAASGNITTLTSSSATITNLTATSATISNFTFTSATVTRIAATSATVSDLSATVSRMGSATVTNLLATSASITTLTNNPTFVGGIANGVLYLNGSKVATSGSTFTFDGTNARIGGSGAGARLTVRGTGTTASTFSFEAATSGGASRFLIADDGLIRFYGTSNAETMRLDNAGNLGIGTSSPTEKLTLGAAGKIQVLRSDNARGGEFFADNTGTHVTALAAGNDPLFLEALGATGQVRFTVGGTERMRIDASGNLGIGTTSPSYKLDVSKGSSGTAARFTASSDNGRGLSFTSSDNGIFLGAIWTRDVASGSGIHAWSINSSEKMRLDSSGNVGIGTSSPTNKLSVAGNANITGNTTLGDASTDTVTVNGYVGVGGSANSTVGMYLQSSGLTGASQIGSYIKPVATSAATTYINGIIVNAGVADAAFTCNESAGVVIENAAKGASATITNQRGIRINDQTQGTNNYGITSLVSSGTNKWNIYASGTANNYFAGNVGIGTSSPRSGYKLDVQEINDNGVNIQAGDTAADIALSVGSPSTPDKFVVQAGGNVGIGTSSPAYKLDVRGSTDTSYLNITSTADANNTTLRIGTDATAAFINATGDSSGTLQLRTYGTTRATIDSSGNLGLGVTPSAWWSAMKPLQMSGNGFVGSASNYTYLGANFFYNSSANPVYVASAAASLFEQGAGAFKWYTAASGTAGNAITFTQAMTLTASGNLGIGVSSPGQKLAVAGDISGDSWIGRSNTSAPTGADAAIFRPADFTLGFCTAGTERARIDSSGNLGLGVTPSASWFSSSKAIQIGSAGAPYMGLAQQTTTTCDGYMLWGARLSGDRAFQYTTTGDGVCAYRQNAGNHAWFTAPSGSAGGTISFTQAMTLDANNQLLLGTTSTTPITAFSGGSIGLTVQSGLPTIALVDSDDTTNYISWLANSSGVLYLYNNHSTSPLIFGTAGTERARITSDGRFCVNATATKFTSRGIFASVSNAEGNALEAETETTANYPLVAVNKSTSGDNSFVYFGTEAAGTARGSINYNRAGGLVAYNTTSDYRAKDITGPIEDAGNTIDALKVYNGKMKDATVERPMLIAHEAQEVAPYAVTGEKDAVNEDGTPKFQQIDHSSLVPLLIAEIQSLRARVAALEGAN